MNLDIQTGIYTKLPQDPTTIRILSVIPDHDENADLECVLTLWDGVDEFDSPSHSSSAELTNPSDMRLYPTRGEMKSPPLLCECANRRV
jgi:hypothetical protein